MLEFPGKKIFFAIDVWPVYATKPDDSSGNAALTLQAARNSSAGTWTKTDAENRADAGSRTDGGAFSAER